jgi:uncharacterized membrane protein HdeD (DUF308 family)
LAGAFLEGVWRRDRPAHSVSAAAQLCSYLIVAWAFVTGVLELAAAYGLRKSVNGPFARGEWLLGVSGVLSLVFGSVVAGGPSPEVARFMWTIGGYAVLSGALLLALAFNIRTWPRTV